MLGFNFIAQNMATHIRKNMSTLNFTAEICL